MMRRTDLIGHIESETRIHHVEDCHTFFVFEILFTYKDRVRREQKIREHASRKSRKIILQVGDQLRRKATENLLLHTKDVES